MLRLHEVDSTQQTIKFKLEQRPLAGQPFEGTELWVGVDDFLQDEVAARPCGEVRQPSSRLALALENAQCSEAARISVALGIQPIAMRLPDGEQFFAFGRLAVQVEDLFAHLGETRARIALLLA